MSVKIESEKLPEEIQNILEEATKEVKEKVNKATRETAKEAAEKLKKNGSFKDRTGKYRKEWESSKRETGISKITGTKTYTVKNKSRYMLTHLLEKGHATRNGGRSKEYPHIKPVEEWAGKEVQQKVESELRNL